MRKKFLRRTGICNITSAFSCNIHFLSKFLVFLQDVDLMSCPCQINTGHHSGSTAAYPSADENALVFGRFEVRLAVADFIGRLASPAGEAVSGLPAD